MITWNWVLEKLRKLEGMHINLIEHIFHIVEIDKVLWIFEMTHDCGDPGRHFFWTDYPYISSLINHIVTQKQLLGLVMNHPGSRGTSHTFRMKSHG